MYMHMVLFHYTAWDLFLFSKEIKLKIKDKGLKFLKHIVILWKLAYILVKLSLGPEID